MAWWTNPNVQIKQKDRFIVSIGEYLIPTIVSCDKPKVTIEKKEYTMINQVYRYPGIAKWQPITMKFVDGSAASTTKTSLPDGREFIVPVAGIDNLDAASMLYDMLTSSGYKSPKKGIDASTTKAAMMDKSFLGSVRIELLEPDGFEVSEGWQLFNPIITEISWGSLEYGNSDAIEYSLTISYDYAEMYIGESKASKGYYNHKEIRGETLRDVDRTQFAEMKAAQERLAQKKAAAAESARNDISKSWEAQATPEELAATEALIKQSQSRTATPGT